MKSILPKYKDLDQVAMDAAVRIFKKDKRNNKNNIVKSNKTNNINKNNKRGIE